ncbi:carboxymuconolactone decarboxylase family protein [Paralimibaculum aggregatum]|uniref:Carboxymuconolactone decarboxylase family protein n=1 Tax=Paralimibaculum aggregatum TaxID=3036245 RepID=A0ABQ6LS45_9RHOB|nr:carboxymuconolactone decarboxylase family protein [Limibaculum sp. NKW23]GMG84546.1 carboxymuconolactone decarboxylase family protein [Limibaculum sp. NKW23]
MSRYTIHTPETAADAARETLAAVAEARGFLPNVVAVLGNAPNVLDALVAMNTQFGAGRLSPAEREIVQLAVSVRNGCGYCVAGHSLFAREAAVPEAEIAALRAGRALVDPGHEALRRLAGVLAAGNGHGADAACQSFLEAGYSREQMLDVILGVAVKTFTNTLSILLSLPLDDRFGPFAWTADEAARPGRAA